jgi:hypothetical protein
MVVIPITMGPPFSSALAASAAATDGVPSLA